MIAEGQIISASLPTVNAAEKIIPMMAGLIPLKIEVMTFESFIFFRKPDRIIISKPGGKKIAKVATQAPRYPATLNPIKEAVRMTGPGVICPMAMASANSFVLNQ